MFTRSFDALAGVSMWHRSAACVAVLVGACTGTLKVGGGGIAQPVDAIVPGSEVSDTGAAAADGVEDDAARSAGDGPDALTSDPDAHAGACTAEGCACTADSQCLGVANDLCAGTLYCDPDAGACLPNPKTKIACGADPDPTDCLTPACGAATGTCTAVPRADSAPCDVDDTPCTPDACLAGTCIAAAVVLPCTCTDDGDCAVAEDGDVCNGELFCRLADHVCVLAPHSVVVCPPAFATCQASACDKKSGQCSVVPQGDGTGCDDGTTCTTNDKCQAGSCVGAAGKCACAKSADCAASDDKDKCNGKLYCDVGAGACKVNPVTVVACPPLPAGGCTTAACDPATGACGGKKLPDGTTCSDGNACTAGDVCKAGACVAGKAQCQCAADADCGAFEDGNLCNGTLYCDKVAGTCKVSPKTVVACPTGGGGPCAPIGCAPGTGKCGPMAAPDGAPCDADGFTCTSDACAGGTCKAGPVACPCWTNADCAAAEDGNPCNGTLYCDKTGAAPACQVNPATVVACQAPTNPCLTAACDPKTGKCATANAAAGTPCPGGSCALGACKAGKSCVTAADCADGKPCTSDLCDAALVCANPPVAEGGACDDGTPCTANDVCKAGKCAGTPNHALCKDTDPCTDNWCKAGVGCQKKQILFCSPCGSLGTQASCKGVCGGSGFGCNCFPSCTEFDDCCPDVGYCCP